jgi:hypothetical protein
LLAYGFNRIVLSGAMAKIEFQQSMVLISSVEKPKL